MVSPAFTAAAAAAAAFRCCILQGFDLALVDAVSRAVSIPVIASSGAGAPKHFTEVRSMYYTILCIMLMLSKVLQRGRLICPKLLSTAEQEHQNTLQRYGY